MISKNIVANKNVNFTFSILVTERCNLKCTYCHFFDKVSRESNRDLDSDLFHSYLEFIKYFNENTQASVAFRFSGGDPIVLKEQLFKLANEAYEITQLQPYMLTAGNGIDENWISKARESALSAALISIENPLNPDPGAMNPQKIMSLMKKFDSDDFTLRPGVTVVKNQEFKNIYEICNIIYEEIGYLPSIQEVNYDSYESPTDKELEELYENLYKVIDKYKKKAHMDFFSYISPIYNSVHQQKDTYLAELNFQNIHNIGQEKNKDVMEHMLKFLEYNYPLKECKDNECDWIGECNRIKWLWYSSSRTVSKEQKIEDYCRFKKTVNRAYYDALVKNEV